MKLHRYSNHDWLVFLSVLFPYIIFVNWLLYDARYLTDWKVFLKVTAIVLPAMVAIYGLTAFYASKIRKRIPGHKYAVKRGLLLLRIVFVGQVLFITLIFWMFNRVHFLDYQLETGRFYLALLATLFMSIISAGLNEASYSLEQWKSTLVKTERLKNTRLQNSLDKLKEQINPHFLFNSLNCLSSLITEDKVRAERFLNELAAVYRYLLNNNEDNLSTLGSELKFIQSYFHLQRTRYTEGVELVVEVPDEYKSYMLPTLTLQLLVENAIKHNSIMAANPLRIRICAGEGDRLSVINNIVPRLVKLPSTNIGLKNIKDKYAALGQQAINIEQTGQYFSVTIPLINSEE